MYKQHPTPNTTASRRNRVSQHDVFMPPRGGKFLTNMRQHAPFIVTTYQGRSDLVSIHAPTWGATFALRDAAAPAAVSIHAPTWGATLSTNSK